MLDQAEQVVIEVYWHILTAEGSMKHRRVSNKKMKQIMHDIGITDQPEDDSQLLLEQREQSVNDDKQLIKLDSENK
ncbi:hypothetical protein VAS14_05503 [Photobacterium angustum S14]|uniref:Uncharacterized protein n=2 Tax=Photobacterium angustum TaxID=661 RepID=Q1ZS27_PHOAS|nr:hypothetical protein VAS14_05503 [Photobacterium angustum S14]